MLAGSPAARPVLDAVHVLIPRIQASADDVERDRRLPAALLRDLAEAGLFRLWLPHDIGGDERDPLSVMQVVEAAARVDGSVGWCVMIANQGALLLPYFDQDVVTRTFTRDDIFAGSLAGGTAVAVDGGYRVTGRWPFASGCTHATWLTGLCRIVDGKTPGGGDTGAPEQRLFAFPAADCEILDTWHTLGLAGTGSHDFTVTDLFVPTALASIPNPFTNPETRRQRWGGPLYKGPFIWPVRGAQALGIARHAIDTLIDIAATKKPFGVPEFLRDLPRVQAAVARAEAGLASVRGYLYDTVADIWDDVVQDQGGPAEHLLRVQLATAYTAEICREVVEGMYRLAGAAAIYDASPLQRCFRDINTLMADQAVAPRLFETVGRAYLYAELTSDRD
jgi:alkylation response protein AidB-like acyl-CoA dehydrogenase